MSVYDLLLTQAWSGAPLYLLAAVLQGIWLHSAASFGRSAIALAVTASTLLTILAAVVIWGRFFPGQEIMWAQIINLPALAACVMVFPGVALLVHAGFAKS